MNALIIRLPATQKGRELLRSSLPAAFGSDRPPGELPDGTNVFQIDLDAYAIELEAMIAEDLRRLDEWHRHQEES